MLATHEINRFAAQKNVSDVIVEKDYILDWILWGIAHYVPMRDNLVFKGGTALHKMYFPDWRFSEDLDFTTVNGVSEEQLRRQISDAIAPVISRSGIRLNLKSIEASGDSGADWSCEAKIEYTGPRGQTTGQLPVVLLHITHDELIMDEPVIKHLLSPYADLPDNPVLFTLTLEEILAEKLRTVIHQRCFPKDVYDVWRIVKEAGAFLNMPGMMEFYGRKSSCRKYPAEFSPEKLRDRISRLAGHWESGLKRQRGNLPDFERVSGDVQSMIAGLADFASKIHAGGLSMMERNYKMKYQKGDMCVEVEGDKAFVEEKFQWLLDLKTLSGTAVSVQPSAQPGQVQTEDTSPQRPIALGEFINQKQPSNHSQYMLCFGYYLEKFRNSTSFTLKEIDDCYREIKRSPNKNYSLSALYLVRDGYVMQAPEKKDSRKAWHLTQTGLDYVEQKMPLKKQ